MFPALFLAAQLMIGGLPRAGSLGTALEPGAGGAAIRMVVPGSLAEKLGLQPGDVITSVNGTATADPAAVIGAIANKRAGDLVTIVARHGDQSVTKEGALPPRPLEKQAGYDIEYGSVDGGNTKRRVIITRPHGEGKHPAVLLIGGIGCYSLDGWTRAGYVTMRVEKSGMGDSEGPPCMDPRADFENEARGYAAGLRYLETLDYVDACDVFIFAHSIGPLAAAQILSEHPVRGIAVAETIGTNWLEYDLTNLRRQLVLGGMPYDEVDRRMREHEVCARRC